MNAEQQPKVNISLDLLHRIKGQDCNWEFLDRLADLKEPGAIELLSQLGWQVETDPTGNRLFFKPCYRNASNQYLGWQIGYLLEKGRGLIHVLKPDTIYDYLVKPGNIREITEFITLDLTRHLKMLKQYRSFKDNFNVNGLRIFIAEPPKNKGKLAISTFIEIIPGITELPGWAPIGS